MTLGEKFRRLIDSKHPSVTAFARKIGKNNTQISNYVNDKVKPSIEFLNIMIEEFPEADLNWLLREEESEMNFVSEGSLKYSRPPLDKFEKIDQIQNLLKEIKMDLAQK